MKRITTLLPITVLLAACGQDSSAPQTAQVEEPEAPSAAETAAPEKHSGVLLDYIDADVRPGDDFNAFVNGAWMATAEIPSDRPLSGVGLEVHEQATENVKVIIEESAEGDFAKGTDEQKVGDLYNSYLDMETRNALGIDPIRGDFDYIASLEDRHDLAVYFAEANKVGVNLPFALGQYVDFKDNNQYMMYTWQGGLGAFGGTLEVGPAELRQPAVVLGIAQQKPQLVVLAFRKRLVERDSF